MLISKELLSGMAIYFMGTLISVSLSICSNSMSKVSGNKEMVQCLLHEPWHLFPMILAINIMYCNACMSGKERRE